MEHVVSEILTRSNTLPFEPDNIGSWWDRSGHEIDIVMNSQKKISLLAGEIKWTNRQVSMNDVEALLENLKRVDWYNDTRKEYLFIVSRSGFSKRAVKLMELKNILGFGVDDLEGILFRGESPDWEKKN